MNSVSMNFSSPSLPPHLQKAIAFLQKPTFLHGFSASFHFLLLILLLIIWISKRFKTGGLERTQETCKGSTFSGYRATLFTCLGLFLFHLFLCISNYFYWCRFGGSEEYHATQLDLVVRTLVWLIISAYLHFDFSQSYGKRFPTLLRIWWGSYFLISCSFIVVGLAYYRKPGILPTHFWVLDFGSFLSSLFLCYTGFVGKRNDDVTPLLQEPLLNGPNDVRSREVTPYQNAGLLSILTFSWMGPLMKVGNSKTLDLDDIPQLADGDSAKNVFHVVHNKLEEYCRSSSNSRSSDPNCRTDSNGVGTLKLAKVLLFSVRKEVLLTGFLAFLNTSSSYVGPYLIDTFVQYLNGRGEYANEGYALVSAFVIAKLIECLSQRHWFFRLQQAGIRVRAALVAILYKKGLSLSSRSKQSHTTGEIINFMAIDAERIEDFSWCLHNIWMIPLQIILALLILYKNLGLASVSALAATVLLMLANFPLGKFQNKYQDRTMKSKDERMKLTSEILRNMRILKLQGWEMKFLFRIMELRTKEENWLKKVNYTSAAMMVVFWGAPTFVAVTFVSCMLMGIPLESGKVLSSLATFRILQEPIDILPGMISMVVQTKVSLNRIASFLRLEDLDPDAVQRLPNGSSDVANDFSNGNLLGSLFCKPHS